MAKGWNGFSYLEGVRQLAWSTGFVGVWNNGYDREQHSDDKTREPEKRQNRTQTEIAHRLSRAPTGSNITVAKCTNTVSFHLPCLMLLENKNSRGGREIVARVSHVDGPRRERRGRDGHFCFYLVLFVFGRVVRGAPCSRKGGGIRDEGHVVTLFLYIDLYLVLVFLSFPLPLCVCDTRGNQRF